MADAYYSGWRTSAYVFDDIGNISYLHSLRKHIAYNDIKSYNFIISVLHLVYMYVLVKTHEQAANENVNYKRQSIQINL